MDMREGVTSKGSNEGIVFSLTSLARSFLEDLVEVLEKTEHIVDKHQYLNLIRGALKDEFMAVKDMRFIYNNLYQQHSNQFKNVKRTFLHQLLATSQLSLASHTQAKEKDPEVEVQLRKAKARAANVQYFNLVKGIIPPQHRMKLEDNRAMREGLKAAVLPLNILFSTVGVFLFFFYVCRWFEVTLMKSFIVGLVAGLVLLFLEIALVFLRSRKQTQKERVEERDTDSKYNVFFEPQYRDPKERGLKFKKSKHD